jgi:hypothetical protein
MRSGKPDAVDEAEAPVASVAVTRLYAHGHQDAFDEKQAGSGNGTVRSWPHGTRKLLPIACRLTCRR